MDIVGVLKDPDLLGHKRVLVPAAIDDAADEITRLRAELAACLEAVGMLTTLAPSMEINVLDPVGMAHQIVATVNAELAEVQAMYEQQGFTIKRQQDELARREEQLSGAMDKINLYERYAMRAIRDLEPYQQANPKLQSLWQRAKNLSTDAARKGEGEVC